MATKTDHHSKKQNQIYFQKKVHLIFKILESSEFNISTNNIDLGSSTKQY